MLAACNTLAKKAAHLQDAAEAAHKASNNTARSASVAGARASRIGATTEA